MKVFKLSLLLFILSISISCDKEEPISLLQNLQNGYWKSTTNGGVRKYLPEPAGFPIYFAYHINEDLACIIDIIEGKYTVEGDILRMAEDWSKISPWASSFKIEGDILTIGGWEYERMETLDYPDC